MRNNKKRWTSWKVVVSVAVSLLITSANYVAGNTSFPLPDEMKVLQSWDQLKKWINIDRDSIPDEVMLIDVSYDKQLADYIVNDIPVGQYAITNRQKLFDFLTAARQADNYKYIMLDVIFGRGIRSPQDSALFQLITSMKRIVIPVHQDEPLEDSILYRKAANADYTVTWEETNFARFQFIHDGVPSMPLRMYQELNGDSIRQCGFLFFSQGWLCRNGITLKMPIRFTADTEEEGHLQKINVLHLGCDVLALDSIVPISDEIKNKIVVIGNFSEDIHETYAGLMPGSIICLNAYYALLQGDHVLLGRYSGVMLFYLFMVILYFFMSMAYLNGFSLSDKTQNPWGKLLLSLVSINVLFWIIAILAYILPLNIVYNVWIPILAFSLLDFVVNILNNNKTNKHEKNTIPAAPLSGTSVD
ncbi:MAG: CHASE2 domain-containing protein [Prevotella sp.]|nr:CHASE2 domain-containing protein [Prevotella sp.]